MNIKQLDSKYVAGTYGRFPIQLNSGSGSLVYDKQGKQYIDLGTGIAVNTFGIADPDWAAAVSAQLLTLQHCSNLYYSEPCVKLAEVLCERTGMKKVFFANSGAEANECAIKAARKYSADKYSPERHKIVTLINSFHGRTITTLAATGQESFHLDFTPQTPGFLYTPANDCEALCALIDCEPNIAAIMFELVQGEGGVVPLTQEFVSCIAMLAEKHDILLICDEVQTGNGRCGSLYSWMQFGITPDIMSTAKGLGGGLPIGACLFGEKTENVLVAGTHGSTFGGNPAVCAGALNVISRIDDKLLAGVMARHDYIVAELECATGVEEISGLGLMIGIKTTRPASDIVSACHDKGVLLLTAHGKVRLLPALNIPMEHLRAAITVLKTVCAS